jgi:iron complex outermembrane receptor protein
MINMLNSGRLKAALMTTAAVIVTSMAAPALAQTGEGSGQAARDEGFALDEVVVTARRREERLQDVPVAVTAISGAEIQRASITRTDELAKLTPGFSVTPAAFGAGQLAPTIRSQRQPLPQAVFDQSVTTYFAEVVQARPTGLNNAFFDIANVQVLKGPQGTLFGRNSTGGALLITPQTPGETFGGYGRLTLGNYSQRAFEGAVNLPLSEAVQVRVAGRIARRDGYVNSLSTFNDIDNEKTEAGRVSIRFAPPDSRFSTTAVFDYLHENDAGGAAFRTYTVTPGGLTARFFPAIADLAALNTHDFFTTTASTPENSVRVRSYGASVISEYKLTDNLAIKNIYGYRRVKSFLYFDLDGSRFPVVDGTDALESQQASDELQLVGTAFDGNLDFILGGYYFRETANDPQTTVVLGAPQSNTLHARNRSKSVFGQATYRIPAVKGLSVTLGGRETWDERYMNGSSYQGIFTGTCRMLTADVGGLPRNPCFGEASVDFRKFTYTASVEYKPTDDVLVYIANRKGYRAGGIPAQPKIPSEFTPFRPEVVKDIEVGLKATWRLAGLVGRTNIAAYTTKYTDVQRSFSGLEDGVLKARIVNAADARVKGFEIEQMIRPIRSLEINLAYGLSDAKYKTFILPNGLDYSDSPFSGAPKHTLSGSIRWELPINPEAGQIALQLNGAYRSKTIAYDVISWNLATQSVIPNMVVREYHTYDARLDWNDIDGRKGLGVSFWIKNLTNEKYYTSLSLDPALGIQAGTLGAPRTFGVDMSYAF